MTKTTPLQELISILERQSSHPRNDNDFDKKWGIEIAIQQAKLLLPSEQKLIEDTWDAATIFALGSIEIDYTDKDIFLDQFKPNQL